mmetsp:Transcript_109135/g.314362  ORF Transcript_109135/g.314362 Transcript_109135/m.314362 type:complete len:233 (+) Transcript_109135:141-839(+)
MSGLERQGDRPVRAPSSSSSLPKGSPTSKGDARFVPLRPSEVAPYLASFGFAAVDSARWRDIRDSAPGSVPGRPTLELQVSGHEEIGGHTWYSVGCILRVGGYNGDRGGEEFGDEVSAERVWRAPRRLEQLREELHDRVKSDLGDAYATHFADTPFAKKGGLPGTTARLNAWFSTLASVINGATCSPGLAALVLSFLDAPALDDGSAFECMPVLQVSHERPGPDAVGVLRKS